MLEFEEAHLDSLPSAEMYEKSYMHRDHLSHVEVAQAAEFFITASIDGHIKFWKKRQQGVEFAKHFRAHLGRIAGNDPIFAGRLPLLRANNKPIAHLKIGCCLQAWQ